MCIYNVHMCFVHFNRDNEPAKWEPKAMTVDRTMLDKKTDYDSPQRKWLHKRGSIVKVWQYWWVDLGRAISVVF